MIRNLTALGLGVMAALALTALTTPVAAAQQGKLTANEPVTLTGGEVPGAGAFVNAQTGPFAKITCAGSIGTGHKYDTTPHELVPPGATTFTMTPHISTKCLAHIPLLGTRPATVTVNGCDFVGHIGETTGLQPEEGATFGVSSSLVCPKEKVVETHIYKTGQPHTPENSICTTTVPAQGPFSSGAHLTSTPDGSIEITGTFTGIHTENTGSICGTGTVSNSQLHFETEIEGVNAEGFPTAISVSD